MQSLRSQLLALAQGRTLKQPESVDHEPPPVVGDESSLTWTDGLGGGENSSTTPLQITLTMLLDGYTYQPPEVIPGQRPPAVQVHYDYHPPKEVLIDGEYAGKIEHIKQCTAIDAEGTPFIIEFADESTGTVSDIEWTLWYELNQ